MTQRLVIFDTTLRDGEQAPGFSMRVEEKLRMARQLDDLGVDIMESGVACVAVAVALIDRDVPCREIDAVIAAGATTINLPDTVGYSTPDEIGEFFRDAIGRVSNSDQVIFSAHCHDDLGLAVANTVAAVTAGVRQVECTINGIGERAGNASLEEIVMISRVRADRVPIDTGIDPTQLFAASQLLSEL